MSINNVNNNNINNNNGSYLTRDQDSISKYEQFNREVATYMVNRKVNNVKQYEEIMEHAGLVGSLNQSDVVAFDYELQYQVEN